MSFDFQETTTLEYLESLYGGCKDGNIVFVKPSRNAVSAVFSVSQLEEASFYVETHPQDLFIKVNVMDHEKTIASNPHGIGGKEQVKAIVSFHLDVDAGKDDKYLTPQKMLDILTDKMPLEPSGIIQTNGDDGGFHAYWLLQDPHYITTEEDRQRCQTISTNWLAELRHHAKPGIIDGTANLDRILRPVGSLRKSGNRVRALIWNDTRRFQLSQFEIPSRLPPQQKFDRKPFDGDSPIEKYLDAVGLNSIEAILQSQGYENLRDGFWRRQGSQSGAPTGQIWVENGKQGFTVKSGAADPLSCENKDGATGNWYSIPALWVSFHCGVDVSNNRNPQAWQRAADYCKRELDARKPKVDTTGIEKQATVKNDQPKNDRLWSLGLKLFEDYLTKLRSGDGEYLYQLPDPFVDFEVGPGLISVWGAGPGTGKTAASSQLLFGALELNPELTATIANAEMGFNVLMRRELVRRTGLPDKRLRFADLSTSDWAKIETASDELKPLMERVRWLEAPYTFDQLKRLHSEAPGLLVVDYLQKFSPDSESARTGVNAVMGQLRHLALQGWGIIALSATTRTHGKGGSNHDGKQLTLASFKESGEIEFNADSAYLLRDEGEIDGKKWLRSVVFCCVKNRNGEQPERPMEFNKAGMRFSLPKEAVFELSESGPHDFYPDSDDELEGFDDGR